MKWLKGWEDEFVDTLAFCIYATVGLLVFVGFMRGCGG